MKAPYKHIQDRGKNTIEEEGCVLPGAGTFKVAAYLEKFLVRSLEEPSFNRRPTIIIVEFNTG